MQCPKCKSENVLKNGHRYGKQCYRCKQCNRQFVAIYSERGYSEDTKQKVENTRLGHYLARLHRKTLCYSKSKEMLQISIRLLISYLKHKNHNSFPIFP